MRLYLTPIDYYIYIFFFGLGASSGIHTLHSEDT